MCRGGPVWPPVGDRKGRPYDIAVLRVVRPYGGTGNPVPYNRAAPFSKTM